MLLTLSAVVAVLSAPVTSEDGTTLQPSSSEDFYDSAPVVLRERARYQAACTEMPLFEPVLQRFQDHYESLDRVLLIDGVDNDKGVNGVGNAFGDYTLWLALAAASQRALFIDWTNEGRKQRFDLSYYFTGRGAADWAWEGDARKRVEAKHKFTRLVELEESGTSCISIWSHISTDDAFVTIKLKPDSSIALVPMCERVEIDEQLAPIEPRRSNRAAVSLLAAKRDQARRRRRRGRKAAAAKQEKAAAAAAAATTAAAAAAEAKAQREAEIEQLSNAEILGVVGQQGERSQMATNSSTEDAILGALAKRLDTARDDRFTSLFKQCSDTLWGAWKLSREALRRGERGPGRHLQLFTVAKVALAQHATQLALEAGHSTHAEALLPFLMPRDEPLTKEALSVFENVAFWSMTAHADQYAAPPLDSDPNLLGRLGACLINDFMHPRPRLQKALVPYLAELEDADSLVALQVRTGWSDDLLSIPDDLEGPSADASKALNQLVYAPSEPESACSEFQYCPQVKAFQSSMRSLLGRRPADMLLRLASLDGADSAPQRPRGAANRSWASLAANAESYGRIDVLNVLVDPVARWQVLNTADRAGFRRAGWEDEVPPKEHLRECFGLLRREPSETSLVPGLRVLNPAWKLDTEHAWTAPLTPLTAVVECAAMVAMAVAEQRAVRNTTDKLGLVSELGITGNGASGWRLYVSSDSPGLIAMLEANPALQGRVLGCIGKHCVEHETASRQHTQRAERNSSDSLQVALDIWFHATADHVLQSSQSTMTNWAVRSPGALRGDSGTARPHVINPLISAGGSVPGLAGDKGLPICEPLPEPRPVGNERPHPSEGDCLALRWAVLSSVAARALRPGSRTQAAVQEAVAAMRRQPGFHVL